MSGKLFIQIVVLMIVFIVLLIGIKCLASAYCPIMSKSLCTMCGSKIAK